MGRWRAGVRVERARSGWEGGGVGMRVQGGRYRVGERAGRAGLGGGALSGRGGQREGSRGRLEGFNFQYFLVAGIAMLMMTLGHRTFTGLGLTQFLLE